MELKDYLNKFEERLVEHDKSREEVQDQVHDICSRALEEADALEERFSEEISKPFEETEARIFGFIEKLNEVIEKLSSASNTEEEEEGKDDEKGKGKKDCEKELKGLINKAQKELSWDYQYKLEHNESAESFEEAYKFAVTKSKGRGRLDLREIPDAASKTAFVVERLEEHLERVSEAMCAAQSELAEVCSARRSDAEELEKKINTAMEPVFAAEDARIQGVVKPLRERAESGSAEEVSALLGKARAAFVMAQRYGLSYNRRPRLCDEYELLVTQEASLEFIYFEERAPTDVAAAFTDNGEIALKFAFFSVEEAELLRGIDLPLKTWVELWEEEEEEGDANADGDSKCEQGGAAVGMEKNDGSKEYGWPCVLGEDGCVTLAFRPDRIFAAGASAYRLRVRMGHCGLYTKWSGAAALAPPAFGMCVWKECSPYVHYNLKYRLAEDNPRVATKEGRFSELGTVIGNMSLPLGQAVSWSVKMLVLREDWALTCIGVAPSDIDQNADNNVKECGWYLRCFDSTLVSGPPHHLEDKEYGPRKGEGEYVNAGSTVGVVMDTAKGELSFVLDGVNRGVAYEQVPLDKPLVPCILLGTKGNSVELDPSGAAENVDSGLAAPGDVSVKSSKWDIATLEWGAVEGATHYQVEVDGSVLQAVEERAFTKTGLAAGTEHSFRVRSVGKDCVSAWSCVVKGNTQKKTFATSVWKECPKEVEERRRYLIAAGSPRVATKAEAGDECSTIVGDTPLPPREVSSWRIKVLASEGGDGAGVFVGVAPSDIGQNADNNAEECGWYFYCYDSTLYSGPPHYCREDACGSNKRRQKKSFHAGSVVGVSVNTTSGAVSFVVDGVKIDNAYKGIPLDKPLVPCVLLKHKDDSVEIEV